MGIMARDYLDRPQLSCVYMTPNTNILALDQTDLREIGPPSNIPTAQYDLDRATAPDLISRPGRSSTKRVARVVAGSKLRALRLVNA